MAITSSRKSPVASYRRRMKRQDLVRVEVQVRKKMRRWCGASPAHWPTYSAQRKRTP